MISAGREWLHRVASCPWHPGFPPSAIRSQSGSSTTSPRFGVRRPERAKSDLIADILALRGVGDPKSNLCCRSSPPTPSASPPPPPHHPPPHLPLTSPT